MTEDEFLSLARWYIASTKLGFVALGFGAGALFLCDSYFLAILCFVAFIWCFTIHHRVVAMIRYDYQMFKDQERLRARFRGKNDDL